MPDSPTGTDRRSFLQFLTMLGVGGQVLLQTGSVSAAETAARKAVDNAAWPGMTYRTLGRTGFRAGRLVYGCGAALSRRPNDRLLNIALKAGVNVFDVGYSSFYGDAERNLAAFARRHRDEIFLISKAHVDVDVDEEVTTEVARRAAATWTGYLEGSLKDLDTDHIDAYYQMAANNTGIVRAEEMRRAFEDAKAAGKVSWFGLSSHENAQECLEAAIGTGWYDLAMIAITPAGWFDWNSRQIRAGSAEMAHLRPLLERARGAGIGLVGMKAGRLLAGRRWGLWADRTAYDRFYDRAFLNAHLSDFQRSYAYVLEHGLDVVNADIQDYTVLKENFIAAATAHEHFA